MDTNNLRVLCARSLVWSSRLFSLPYQLQFYKQRLLASPCAERKFGYQLCTRSKSISLRSGVRTLASNSLNCFSRSCLYFSISSWASFFACFSRSAFPIMWIVKNIANKRIHKISEQETRTRLVHTYVFSHRIPFPQLSFQLLKAAEYLAYD